ncbi:hypothetical protein E2C01_070408 [Portunus trituberculatus]|uniref:Uncharacterized protein n=1 Tax=Portunus trituberculatus TaxID=210409 RepID=A0A5B7I3F2_PORTR|nr:hypothetical protein [Portunus trituberculatus]
MKGLDERSKTVPTWSWSGRGVRQGSQPPGHAHAPPINIPFRLTRFRTQTPQGQLSGSSLEEPPSRLCAPAGEWGHHMTRGGEREATM